MLKEVSNDFSLSKKKFMKKQGNDYLITAVQKNLN